MKGTTLFKITWRKKLFFFAIIVALIPIAISGTFIIDISKTELTSSTNEELTNTAGGLAKDVNDLYKNWFQQLFFVKNGLENPDLDGSVKASFVLSSVQQIDEIISMSVYFDVGGKEWANAISSQKNSLLEKLKEKRVDAEKLLGFDQNYIHALLDSNQIVGKPEYSDALSDWKVVMALPVNIPDAPPAFLAANISLASLGKKIRENPFNKKGRVFIIDEYGEPLFSEDKDILKNKPVINEVKKLLQSPNRLQSVTNYTSKEGEKIVSCYAFPSNLKWAVIAEIEEAKAYEAVDEMLNTFLLWILIGVGIAGAGALIFSSSISKPILKLGKEAEKISRGDFDIKVDYQASDSIGVLARTLENTSKSLKESFAKIEQQNKELEDYSRTLEIKVDERTAELKEKNTELETTLQKLKDTQNQLVAHEKLASLGALTAGIAHEIKNPLNFVNNFAKLTGSLVEELMDEIKKYQQAIDANDFQLIDEIAGDLILNVTKINEHGKRADSIVKAMLEHSRGDTGEMQKVSLTEFLEEFVNLAYHGMRSQDSTFNVKLVKNYSAPSPQLKLNPQAFSRVILNICNNAFYATTKRFKKGEANYEPIFTVTTKDANGEVEISLKDNGTGIPQSVVNKIFEPFFTTKPTGEGTGLGLSLTYDIVTKMHNGSLVVNTEENSFTEFLIKLPKNI